MSEFAKEGLDISFSMIVALIILIILVFLLLSGVFDQVVAFIQALLASLVIYLTAQLHLLLR